MSPFLRKGREMGLTGNLKTMDMPELLQWAASSAKSGELKIINGDEVRKVFFRDGFIIGAASNVPSEHLGQFLLSYKKLTVQQLKEALLEQKKSRKKLGEILLEKGWITPKELRNIVYIHTLEIIYNLFLLEEGEFVFTDDPHQTAELFNLKLPVDGVVMEGVYRKDEWKRIRKVFPSDNITFEVLNPEFLKNSSSFADRRIYKYIKEGKTLKEIAYEMRHMPFQTYKRLFELYESGIIKIKEKKRKEPEKRIIYLSDLYKIGREYEERGKFEKALAVYWKMYKMKGVKMEDVEWIEKAVQRARKILLEHYVPLHGVPYLKMSLQEIMKYKFTPEEGYMISRIDGVWDTDSIIKVSPLKELDALYFFKKLKDRGIVDFKSGGSR